MRLTITFKVYLVGTSNKLRYTGWTWYWKPILSGYHVFYWNQVCFKCLECSFSDLFTLYFLSIVHFTLDFAKQKRTSCSNQNVSPRTKYESKVLTSLLCSCNQISGFNMVLVFEIVLLLYMFKLSKKYGFWGFSFVCW